MSDSLFEQAKQQLTDPKLQDLLRAGLADPEDVEAVKRAIRYGKDALKNQKMRDDIYKTFTRLLDIVKQDNQVRSKVRQDLIDKQRHREPTMSEAQDLNKKNVDKAVEHDCAKHVVHEQWGKGQCLPEQHELADDGTVSHYDVMFEHGIEKDVPTSALKVVVSETHMHAKRKKMMEEQAVAPMGGAADSGKASKKDGSEPADKLQDPASYSTTSASRPLDKKNSDPLQRLAALKETRARAADSEQIDELSQKTLVSYYGKAIGDRHAKDLSRVTAKNKGDYSTADKLGDKVYNRSVGLEKAHKKFHAKDVQEEKQIDEKHLTAAELKKREKIAKGIEKSNPNMPMGKKMAIATAKAKQIDEAVKIHDLSHHTSDHDAYDHTQIDDNIKHGDILKLSGGRYGVMHKAWPVMVHGTSDQMHVAKPEFWHNNSEHNKARDTIHKLTSSHVNEDVEQVDESDSPTAGTRIISKHEGKNGHQAQVRYNSEWQEYSVHHYKDGKHMGEGPVSYHGGGKEGKEDATNTAKHVAETGLNEGVEQVDEISKAAVGEYLRGATHDVEKRSLLGGMAAASGRDGQAKEYLDKVTKRRKGINKAISKLAEAEEVELDESSGRSVVDNLKSRGKYEEAGAAAHKHGLGRNYGPHFGMRDTYNRSEAAFHRGYDKAELRRKYAGKDEHLAEDSDQIDEISHATLTSYVGKAKQSADDLAAQGKYKKSTDRRINVITAQTKQIGKRIAGIKQSMAEEGKQHTVPKTPKEKALAALAEPKDKITHADVITGRTKGKMMKEFVEQIASKLVKE